jgi:hypothetical protein
LIDGSITIPAGDTLTLGAGTTLLMRKKSSQYAWQSGDTILVEGHIRANGTVSDSVKFDMSSPERTASEWFGIMVRNGGTASLKYSSIIMQKSIKH